VIPLSLPPLRDRPGDIPLLAGYYTRDIAQREQRPCPSITADAMACLEAWSWPGNVRELQNVVERGYLLGDRQRIRQTDLPTPIAAATAAPVPLPSMPSAEDRQASAALDRRDGSAAMPLKDYLTRVEANYIAQAIQAANSNKQRAATLLGVSLTTLYRKLGADARSN
jgi:DNA-binding NtrC family response regulator